MASYLADGNLYGPEPMYKVIHVCTLKRSSSDIQDPITTSKDINQNAVAHGYCQVPYR